MNKALPLKAVKIGLFTLLAAFFFYTTPYVYNGLYTSGRIYISVAALFMLLAALAHSLANKKEVRISIVPAIILLMLLAMAISALKAGINRALYFERFGFWFSLFLLSLSLQFIDLAKEKNRLKFFMLAGNWAVVILCALQQAGFFFKNPILGNNDFGWRAYGVFGNPDILALYIIMSLPFVFSGLLKNRNAPGWSLLAINLIFLALTGSASGILALAAAVILYLLYYRDKLKKGLVAGVLVAALGIIIGVFLFTGVKKTSVETRVFLWKSTAAMIKENIFSGVGAGNYGMFIPYYQGREIKKGYYPSHVEPHDEIYAHNDYLQFFAEAGILGLAAFLIFIFYPLYFYFGRKRAPGEDLPFAASLSVTAFFAIGNFPLEVPFGAVFFTVFACVVTSGSNTAGKKISVSPKLLLVLAILAAINEGRATGNFYARKYLEQKASYLASTARFNELIKLSAAYERYFNGDYLLCFYKGAALSAQGFYTGAIESNKQALRLYPYFGGAMFNLANAYFNAGMYKEAAEGHYNLIEFNPKYMAAYYNSAGILMKAGRLDSAIKVLRAALEAKPSAPETYYYLAFAYFMGKDYPEAEKMIMECLRLEPVNQRALSLHDEIRKEAENK